MIGQAIYVFVFCFCFLMLIHGLPYRHSPWVGIPLLCMALFLLYTGEDSTLSVTLVRYARFVVLYFVWSAFFLRIHIRYAIYLSVAYQVFMGIWFSCVQVAFFYLGINSKALLVNCTGLLRVLSIFLLRRYFLNVSASRDPSILEMMTSLFPAVACFIANLVLFDGLNLYSLRASYRVLLPILVIFFGLSALLVIVSGERYFDMNQYKLESERARQQLEAQYQLLLKEQENNHRLYALHHDMSNHLQTIRAMANTEGVQDYIHQLEGSARELEPQFLTGDPTLDALLGMKKAECDEKDIQLECYIHLTQTDYLPSMELCALFFNCIDNAIEAISAGNPPDRRIHLTGGEVNGKMVIRIENSYTHNLKPKGAGFTSTKPDQNSHGFGLANVQEIVERHNGTITFQTDGGKFIVTWCIPHS